MECNFQKFWDVIVAKDESSNGQRELANVEVFIV